MKKCQALLYDNKLAFKENESKRDISWGYFGKYIQETSPFKVRVRRADLDEVMDLCISFPVWWLCWLNYSFFTIQKVAYESRPLTPLSRPFCFYIEFLRIQIQEKKSKSKSKIKHWTSFLLLIKKKPWIICSNVIITKYYAFSKLR